MSDSNKWLEVEVKFLVADLAALRTQLVGVGATVKMPRVFERNLRLDTVDEALLAKWELLRVRQDTAVRVTFKGPANVASEAKVREEIEMEVADFDTAVLIFTRLGYVPTQTYEKYRETFQIGDVEIVLDEMPYGDFVELEGTEAGIKSVAAQLGLEWKKRILDNYLSLMGELKSYHELPFNDLTFDNFKGLSISVADVL